MVLISKQQSKQACFFLSTVHPRSLNPRAIKKTALFEGELLRTSVISTRGMDSLNCQWLQEWGRGNEAYSTHNLSPNPRQSPSLWENSSGDNQERVGKLDETTQLEAMPHALLSCCEQFNASLHFLSSWWWFSCYVVSDSCNPTDCSLPGSSVHGILQARILENTGCCFLLQGFFPSQGSNPGLLHCRQTLYLLNYKGSPFLLW